MTAIIRKMQLSRRAILRAAGAAIALPWLESMAPALARRASPPGPARALFVFAPNGKKMDEWTPPGGPELALPHLLEPLAGLRTHLLVVSGLTLDGARAKGDGPGDHARAAAAFLTTAHPRKTGGADIYAGISIDQAIAAEIGRATRLPSLELGLEPGRAAGVCDSGYSCAYTNNVSWRGPSTPVAKETRPREVFRRLFGGPPGGDDPAAARRHRDRRSVLDAAVEDARRLQAGLPAGDRAKVEEYLGAVRELERRVYGSDEAAPRPEPPESFQSMENGYRERLRQMYDVLVLAFATDQTRVATLMLGNGGSNQSYRFLGVPDGHHTLSHHGKDPKKLDAIRRINRFHVEELARFATALHGIREGEATLLDRAIVVYGSGISDGDRHNHDDLPVVVVGRGLGAERGIAAGQHRRVARETPLANLHLTVARAMGAGIAGFGDATGPL